MMQPTHKVLTAVLSLAISAYGGIAAANDFSIEVSLGGLTPDAESYRTASNRTFSAAYFQGDWLYRAGYIGSSKMELRHAPDETYIKIEGGILQISRLLRFDPITLEAGAGVFFSTADVVYGGTRLDKERDTSPFVGLQATLPFNKRWAALVGYRYFFDVSGSDLRDSYVGVSFSF